MITTFLKIHSRIFLSIAVSVVENSVEQSTVPLEVYFVSNCSDKAACTEILPSIILTSFFMVF